MRKNLNKIVAFAIGVSVISGLAIPVMADTKVTYANSDSTNQNNAKQVLTLEDAINGAKSCSNTIAILDENIRLMQNINSLSDKKDDVVNSSDDSGSGLTDTQKDYDEDKRKLQLNQLEQKRDFMVDKLSQSVTNAYNGLIISQLEISQLKNDIELQKTEIQQYNLKKSLGLVTDINIDQVNLGLQKNLNDLDNKQNTLKDDKENFKVLTGKDVDQYTLEDKIEYKKFALDGSLDEYLDGVIDEYVSYTQEINDLNKDFWNDDDNKVTNGDVSDAKDFYEANKDKKAPNLSDYLGDKTGDDRINAIADYLKDSNSYTTGLSAYTGAIGLRMNYLQNKSSVTTSELELNETKDQYKKALRTMYTNLLNIEKSIDLLNSNVELSNKQLRINKINYDLGLKTKLDYDKSVSESETLNNQLKSTINSYNTLKAQLEKPWIALS
ncbi:TolC family protein [Clostridium butyricum]|uniref:TolC family protein n=1 Tax=Clostridium butyricum TaxID=1492 RepID=UPI0013D31AB7|nr:TolC family protein [Clostridium butyricum]MCQ2019819.1 TolC family protein [Clostridium butyricum]NFB73301.1 TolC family protein [Clostridium butyricum]NFB90072.1 TolC family protein [Clostridium butyricum]